MNVSRLTLGVIAGIVVHLTERIRRERFFEPNDLEAELRLTKLSLPQVVEDAPELMEWLADTSIGGVPLRISEQPASVGDWEVVVRTRSLEHLNLPPGVELLHVPAEMSWQGGLDDLLCRA